MLTQRAPRDNLVRYTPFMNRRRRSNRWRDLVSLLSLSLLGAGCSEGGQRLQLEAFGAHPPIEAVADGRSLGWLPLDVTLDELPDELLLRFDDEAIPPPPEGMVLVPGGRSVVGTDGGNLDEAPAHQVFLDPFFIDRTEVTVDRYTQFVGETGYPPPANWDGYTPPREQRDHPVTYVSWFDAGQYATWAGNQLPTEAQWERAARGGEGRTWPWGDTWDEGAVVAWHPDRVGPEPVGSRPDGASPCGALDLAGNVWEWVEDSYDTAYFERSPVNHPVCIDPVNARVIKGGSWVDAGRSRHRPAFRYDSWPGFDHYDNVGFRTVRSAFRPVRIQMRLTDGGASGGGSEGWTEELTTGIHSFARGSARPPVVESVQDLRVPTELNGQPALPMVVVPAGRAIMGDDSAGGPQRPPSRLPDHDCKDTYYRDVKEIWGKLSAGEGPAHLVTLSSFRIDATPVTNGQYHRYMNAIAAAGEDRWKHPDEPPDKTRRPHYWPDAKWNKDLYPVVGVDWYDAYAYCNWTDRRLPTDAEWERAARGEDGRKWPWGSTWIPDGANLMAEGELRHRGIDGRPWPWPVFSFGGDASPLYTTGDGYENLAPVGVFPAGASPYGVLDMAGQVFEWVADWYTSDALHDGPDPTGPPDGDLKVLRGGAFLFDERFATTTFRHADRPDRKEMAYYGFRCAANP